VNIIEKTGKTVDEAVELAFKELNITKDQAEVSILDPGSKGIFGFGAKPAKVSVKVKFDPENIAKTFIRELAAAMGLEISIKSSLKDNHLYVELKGAEIGVLIGKRGQTLDALQHLVSLVVNKGLGPYINVNMDSENYRKRRKETLESLAVNLAKKAKSTKREVVLEPMTSYERRIIHSTLQNDRNVSTYSQGVEPFRNVVISPK